ncbi:MAG: PD-(D/E)XK nuclease family protein [Desulfuromonadaceae bacterium]|nr:PD-(D/E)XK nuclease family protein [Desulfuromonadaceae bacterium]
MLCVYFGVDLDGYQSLNSTSRCGEVTLGPLGFLALLETRLALSSPLTSEACRTVQYRTCLQEADDGERFYSASFAADPQTTANTLLQWRDTWVAGGWEGTCAASDAQTLRDLAAVELLAPQHLGSGVCDRLRALLTTLRSNPLPDLNIRLAHDPALLPYLWQEILTLLDAELALPDFLTATVTTVETDLQRLQQALRTQQTTQLHNDGSVMLLSAHNETQLARALSQIIYNCLPATKSPWFSPLNTTLLHGGHPGILDTVFAGDDAPRTGQTDTSCWRPPLQILSMALSLLWQPLDPYRLLEFLTHPVGPLPRRVRNSLAEVVAQQPGIGGDAWNKEMGKLVAAETERNPDDPQAAEKLRTRIDFWLAPQRYNPSEGAPLTVLAERCNNISHWGATAARRPDISGAERTLLNAASAQAAQASTTLDLLRNSGDERLTKLQLERLLDQVTAVGTPIADQCAELGHIPLHAAPGAIIEANQRVLWWHFIEPVLPARSPWNKREREQLRAAGVHLPSNQQLLELLSKQWLQPILAAENQIIFALPRTLNGEATRHHPLWDLIESLTDKNIPHIDVGDAMALPADNPSPLHLTTDQVTLKPLPVAKRWWHLSNPALLGPRIKAESYSSLEKFVNSPYQWVLNYKAGLYPAKLERIDLITQRGNLLHHLIEYLFGGDCDWRHAEQTTLQAWAHATFEELLLKEGANLLLPGRIKEREELISVAKMAVWQLVRYLRAAKVVTAVTEEKIEGSFSGGMLTGYVDLLVTNEQGEEALIDLKWGGTKFRRSLLQENLALQLALYAKLRRAKLRQGQREQPQGRWPAQAFFILQEGRLLAQNQLYFPTAEVCAPADPNANAQTLWADFEETWRWRRAQLDSGLIEITVSGTSADAQSASPGMPIEEHNDRFSDFDALTGWQEGI